MLAPACDDEANAPARSGAPLKPEALLARAAADGAAAGAGLMALANLLEWAGRRGIGNIALFELPRLRLSGWAPEILLQTATSLVSGHGQLALGILILLWVVRWTRPIARVVTAAAVALIAAWIAALATAMAFLLQPSAALLLVLLALLPAVLLARAKGWNVTAMVVLSAGLALGTFGAQVPVIASYGIVAPDGDSERVFSPLYGFLPLAIPALAGAWLVSRTGSVSAAGLVRRIGRFWGLCVVCLSTTFAVAVEVTQLRAGPAEPSGVRVLNEFAFDVYVTGEPPALLWTDRRRVQVLENAYGETHRRRVLDDEGLSGLVERITPSFDGGFYIAVDEGGGIGWWKPVPPHEPIPDAPSGGWLQEPDWVRLGMAQLELAADPVARRLLVLSQIRSRYAVLDRDTNSVASTGVFSDALLGASTPTADPAGRAALLPSLGKDGATSEFDFESLQITRRASNHYLMEIAVDPSGELLWGTRPLTGELLGVDRHTFQIRHRIPIEPTLRPVVQDPETGTLYTCSFLFGGIFRVDRLTLEASKIGWCGRLCRRLRWDARHASLWVATADGVCRIPVTEPPASR